MKRIAIIPARMGSSRFPGKPMKQILGMPMIEHVYRRTAMCTLLDDLYVATCDQEIYDHVLSFGGKAVMTSASHERCTDRCAEALHIIEDANGYVIDVVVMVQGDEPLTHPSMIEDVIRPTLNDSSLGVVNLAVRIDTIKKFNDPNVVKAVVDESGNAIYFSREPLPSLSKIMKLDMNDFKGTTISDLQPHLSVTNFQPLQQLGLILFRRDFLLEYNAMIPTPLEEIESCDMLRVLEHRMELRVAVTEYINVAVDVPGDIAIAEQALRSDVLWEAGYK